MSLTPFVQPGRLLVLALAASLAWGLGVPAPASASEAAAAPEASEPSIKPRLRPELRGEAQSARGEVKSEVKSEGRPEVRPETKASARVEPKAEPKAESKAEPKSDAKSDAKEPVSMVELRNMIEQKISEVRTTRGPAPVVRVKAKGPRSTPSASSGGAGAGAMNAATSRKASWSHHGETGPEHWAQLKPEFALCGSGQRQSPIDIRDGIPVELDPIQFEYKLSAFRVIDNGHTVQVNVEPGNRILVNGRRFDLVQFHFHRPSEEKLNGKQFEMVAHLEHRDLEGKLAVVAVLIDEGKAHPLVQQVWNNLPLEKHTEQPGLNALDPNLLLPERRQYVTYMGSMTTPPCTEGVLWMVMKEPVTLSRQQIGIFSRLYPMNARPVQPTGDRLIKDGQ